MLLYLVFPLVTSTQCAFHGVTSLNTYLSPHYNTCCRFFRFFHDKTAAAHTECWGCLAQNLRESLPEISNNNNIIEKFCVAYISLKYKFGCHRSEEYYRYLPLNDKGIYCMSRGSTSYKAVLHGECRTKDGIALISESVQTV